MAYPQHIPRWQMMCHTVQGRHIKLKLVLRVALVFFALFSLFTVFINYPSLVRHQVQPKVGKVTMLWGNNSVYERALETHKEHSRRLGYPLFRLQAPVLDGFWNKMAIVLSVLLQELQKPVGQRLEWLLYFDADTVLMNPNMPLETFLPPPQLPDVHLLLAKDWNGMNNGVFLIRVHPWSVQLLTATTAYPIYNPKVDLHWFDQSAMSKLIKMNDYFSRSTVYCPLRWFNAYMRAPNGRDLNPDSPSHLQVHPGDLLVHFPGTPKEKLGETLGPYMAIAEAHRAEWEQPLENTGYIEETESFWKGIHSSG